MKAQDQIGDAKHVLEGEPQGGGLSRREAGRLAKRRRIFAAGLEVLEHRRLEGLTMAEVANRADVSVGSIYNLFGDKDELVSALHAEFLARLSHDDPFQLVDEDAALPELVRGLVEGFVGMLRRHEGLNRAFMSAAQADQQLIENGSQLTRAFAREFQRRLLRRRSEFTHPDPVIAADMCFRLVYDVVARRLSRGVRFESDLELSWDRMIQELTRACLAYVAA